MSIRNLLASVRSAPPLYKIIGGVIFVLVIVLGVRHVMNRAPEAQTAEADTSHVAVASVADLSSQAGPLSLVGTVTSLSQATILSQTSGEVVSLAHAVGDHVSAGGIIGQFDNASQRAAVTQAEGSYEAAQAALAKATGTTAANSGITSGQAATAEQNAATALTTSLQSAYASLDDAVHTKADAFFISPRSATPNLIGLTIPDSQLVVNVENERAALEQTLSEARASAEVSSSTEFDTRAEALLADAQTTESFLNDLISALNQAVPNTQFSATTIAADQASAAAARTEVVTAITSLTTAKGSYDSAAAGAQTAANSASTGTQSDIDAAQASLKSAQGALQAAQANLEKTIIRSPISGTIVSLPVTQGDYVSSFTQVAVVSNPGALYVDADVTPDDTKTLSVGNAATIAGGVTGVVTFIAPAIDPSTGKIEVKIGLKGDQGTLTDGEVATVSVERSSVIPSVSGKTQITIPIVALKMAPTGAEVFTVSTSSTLLAHPVTIGSILGDQVVILSGLTPDMRIITDARGLSNGQTVIVSTSTPL